MLKYFFHVMQTDKGKEINRGDENGRNTSKQQVCFNIYFLTIEIKKKQQVRKY